jgi:hypothetical protein
MSSLADRAARPAAQIDPRGQRFAAGLTTLLFAAALVAAPSPLTVALLTWQLATFVLGAVAGPARTPYAWVFRTLVRPRLGKPRELEDARPPRFAQAVGLAFTVVSLAGYVAGAPLVGAIAAGMALAAAFLNAAFGYCLGCEMYLFFKRASVRTALSVLTDAATR